MILLILALNDARPMVVAVLLATFTNHCEKLYHSAVLCVYAYVFAAACLSSIPSHPFLLFVPSFLIYSRHFGRQNEQRINQDGSD